MTKEGKTRKYLYISDENAENVEKYAEKTTLNQSKIIDLALDEFFKNKEV